MSLRYVTSTRFRALIADLRELDDENRNLGDGDGKISTNKYDVTARPGADPLPAN
jgi:hypothetical protein